VTGLLRRLDAFQRRRSWAGFGYAVVRKYSDDQAGHYAALLAYYAFLSVFPLLLVAVSALGIALRDSPDLQRRVLDSGLASFPVIGNQLRADIHSLDRSGVALAVGLVTTFIGARGLADAAQSAFNGLWQVPYTSRPGFPKSLLRSLALLGVLAVGAAVTGFTAAAAADGSAAVWERLLVPAAGLVMSGAMFVLGFRLATARVVPTRQLVPGALAATVVWQLLIAVGGLVVAHYVTGASQVYGTFATVIGMLAWFALQAQVTLYAVEMDVVRSRRLWPRSLLNPPLTAADESVLRSYAQAEARVGQQQVTVRFGPTAPAPAPASGTGPRVHPRREGRPAGGRATLVVTAVAGAAAGLLLSRLRGGSSRRS
jgi:membrane protein